MKNIFKIAFAAVVPVLLLAGCSDSDKDLMPAYVPFEVTDITNVMIPQVSLVPGMTLTIPGNGFNAEDTKITLHPASGSDIAVNDAVVDEHFTGITLDLPDNCPAGSYTFILTRSNGTTVQLGKADVKGTIELSDVQVNEVYNRDGWITIHGSGFYQGDAVLFSTFDQTYTIDDTAVSSPSADGGSIKFESPAGVTGNIKAKLKRGVATVDLPSFIVGELLSEITDVEVPAVSITAGMTLTVSAEGIATTDLNLVLRSAGGDIVLQNVALTEDTFTFTIPATAPAGEYELYALRTDNTEIGIADIELVTAVVILNASPALAECPINEPIAINGEGFYPGDKVRFKGASPSTVDVTVNATAILSPEGAITGIRFTPPVDFIGLADISVVRGAVTTDITDVLVVDYVGNVVVPSFSIVPGQTVKIAATNVKSDEVLVLRPSSGPDITPTKVSTDATGYTMTIPNTCSAGAYTLVSTRNTQNLGTVTISASIVIDGLELSDNAFIKGAAHDVVIASDAATGAKTFAPGDRILFVNELSANVVDQLITYDVQNVKFTLAIPATHEGVGTAVLQRGILTLDLGTVDFIDQVSIGDYHKGGIVVWLDSANPAHGICMNLFHGDATQRNVGVLHNRRMAFGHRGVDHGTDGEEYHKIGMGDVNTKMILDAEEAAGLDPSALDESRPWDGIMRAAAYVCDQLVITDIYSGVTYDDWYLPSLNLVIHVLGIRHDLNPYFDQHGGESFAGTGYTYQHGTEAGSSGYDAGDGSANYISSNQAHQNDDPTNQARYYSYHSGNQGWYSKMEPYYYVRAARKF